jgi:hypothetical protein
MEALATYADQRPVLVCAAAPRSAAIADAEQRYSRYGVVAVAVGWCPDLELADVGCLFARQLRLHESQILVTMRAPGEYILLFDSIDTRNMAVQWQGALNVGPAAFMISAWTRFIGARAGKLCYKARVCIEGVPADAHQVDTIRGLFAASDIIDSIDTNINSKEESACCRVWVWMENVGKLARRGKLDLEEPLEVDSPLLHFPELGIDAGAPSRRGPLKTLSYDVILHLDRVLDYSSSPPSSPDSHVSFHSDVSGMPSEISMTLACPTTWGYCWFLGFEAGTFPQPPARPSVQSRLRFPDRRDGDDGDGAGSGAGDRRSSRHGEQGGGNPRRYGGGGQE